MALLTWALSRLEHANAPTFDICQNILQQTEQASPTTPPSLPPSLPAHPQLGHVHRMRWCAAVAPCPSYAAAHSEPSLASLTPLLAHQLPSTLSQRTMVMHTSNLFHNICR